MSREFSGNSTFFRTGSHIAEEHSPITPEWYWVLAHRLPRPRLLEKYIFVAQKKIQFPWTHGFDSCYPKKATLGGEQNVKVHRDLGIPIVFYNNLQQLAAKAWAGRLKIQVEVKSVMKIAKLQTSFVSSFNNYECITPNSLGERSN